MHTSNAVVLFLLFESGCLGGNNGSNSDADGGSSSPPESGIADSAKTNWGDIDGRVSLFDARTAADGRRFSPDSLGPACGNNIREEGEVCDGPDLPCPDGMFGTISCSIDCLNFEDGCSSAPGCGNNVKDEWESCDGSDLEGETCFSLRGQLGRLRCNEYCDFDMSFCYDEFNPVDDGGVDDESRLPVSRRCAINTGARCETDQDCVPGGCGGELCYNPAYGQIATDCDCTGPADLGCGCVNGICTWWTVDSAGGI